MRARIARIAKGVRDAFPLTLLGALVAALAALALYSGLSSMDLVLLGAGLIGLLALLGSILAVLAGLLRVRIALRRMPSIETPLVLECGFPVRTGFRLPRLRFIPGARVSWRWIAPDAKVRLLADGGWLEEEVLPATRGLRESLSRRIELFDAFGLASIAIERTEVRSVRLLPSTGGLKQMHVVRTLSGGSDYSHHEGSPDGERLDMRAYSPGDPIRYVLWNVFARTRQLVIRTPERALSAARKTLAYLVAGAGDEPAAGAARVAVDVGALGGDWAFGADGVAEPASTKEAALEALAKSAHAPRESSGRGLATFLREAAVSSAGRALVFVPGKPGPWLDGIIYAAAQMAPDVSGRVPLEFIVCTDGVSPKSTDTSPLRRLALLDRGGASASDAPVAADELSRVVAALGRLRARVIVVDRRHGHVHVAAG